MKGPDPIRSVRFGLFEFDLERLELRRAGQSVRLQQQPAKVLAALLKAPGRVVERAELQDKVWGDTHVQSDAGLNFCIRQIRDALADNAENPRFVQTVRGRGYRFLGPVEEVQGAQGPHWAVVWRWAAALALLALASGWAFRIVPGRVAEEVVAALPDELREETSDGLPREAEPPSPAGGELKKGHFHLEKNTGEGLAKAVSHFEEAIRLAPEHSAGYVGLAKAVSSCPFGSYGGPERVRELLDAALSLNPESPEGNLELGNLQFFSEWDWEAARTSFERAAELDPRVAEPHKGLAFYYSSRGEHEEAIEHVQRALLLDPVSVNLKGDLGWFFFRARRYAEARDQCLETLELEPEDPNARFCLMTVALTQGDHNSAWLHLRSALGESEEWSDALEELDRVAAADPARAVDRYRTLRVERLEASPESTSPARLAIAHAELGNTDRALYWLERGYEEGSQFMPFLAIAPPLDPLRSDPRFQELVKRLGLPLGAMAVRELTPS